MIFTIQVTVMPLKDLLDPQGKAVCDSLHSLGMNALKNVRVGKNIYLQIESDSKEEAISVAEECAKKLLSNPVMENFEINVLS